MLTIISHIREFTFLHSNIAYILIVIGIIVEGEFIVILAGIFTHLGALNMFITIGAIFLGAGIKATIGYNLGSYLQNNHSNSPILYKMENKVNHFFPHFKKHPFWSVFLARSLIFGLHWFALIYAGYKKIQTKVFAKAEFFSLIIWTTAMMSLGYFFSYAAFHMGHDIRKFIFLTLIFFIGFFVLEKVIAFFVELIERKEF